MKNNKIKKSKVTVVKTSPSTVLNDYSRLMDLADYKKYQKDKETIIKLNLSWSLFYPACSTTPWQLEGVLKKLTKDKQKNIIAVENKTVVTKPIKGAINNKWLSVLKKYNVPYIPLTKVKWVEYKTKSNMLALDSIFKKITIPEMFIGKEIVHLPTMKVHGHSTITGSIKNAFGGLITQKRHHCHKKIHEVLVDLLQIQKEIHPSIFSVIDGTVAGDGKGPRTMVPRYLNTLLASKDPVAIDAISATMMGFDPMKIKFIKIAHDLGLGNGDIDQIEIIGDNFKISKFKVNKSPVIFFDRLLRNNRIIENLLFKTPLFKTCILGSAVYHDYIWYNLIGRKRVNEFMKTDWGKLFKSYK